MASMREFGWAVICAGLLGAGLPLATSAQARAEGPPPSPVCDAWLEFGGSFGTSGNESEFALVNRSTVEPCVATRVMVLFEYPAAPEVVTPAAPVGWRASGVRCAGGRHHLCGMAWEGPGGVPAGGSMSGFRLTTAPSVLVNVWVVEVGGQRVALQVGAVGG